MIRSNATMLEPEEIDALSAAVASLHSDLGTEIKISLFGSRARRDHRPDSDYDLLCVIPEGTPRDIDWMSVMDRADIAMGQVVDGAVANIQFIAEHALEDAYFELDFMPSAVRDGIDVADLLGVGVPNPTI
jgi:predicted nucleotidyltransferase